MKSKNNEVSGEVATEPSTFVDMVGYQKGSVVSRTIINKKSGTVTLFAFDKGEGLSEHTSPFEALLYVIDGEAQVKVAAYSFVLQAGQMVIMPANKPHSLRGIQKFKMLLVMVRS